MTFFLVTDAVIIKQNSVDDIDPHHVLTVFAPLLLGTKAPIMAASCVGLFFFLFLAVSLTIFLIVASQIKDTLHCVHQMLLTDISHQSAYHEKLTGC